MLGLTDDFCFPLAVFADTSCSTISGRTSTMANVGAAGRSCRWECAVWLYRARYGPFLVWLSLRGAGEVDQARLGEEWLRIKGI
jgi:hypothetical protein